MPETYIKRLNVLDTPKAEREAKVLFLSKAIMDMRIVCSQVRNKSIDEFFERVIAHDESLGKELDLEVDTIVICLAFAVWDALYERDKDQVFYITKADEKKMVVMGSVAHRSSFIQG